MKRTMKKSISVLLTFTLLFGSLAFGFSDVDWSEFAVRANAEDVVASGTGGKNITWTLYADGEFVIDGTGEMYNFGSVRDVPWRSNFSKIKKVTVCEGITSISYGVFYGCDNLSTVTIPESVTKIGDSAFSGCSNISAAYYPGTEEQWAKVRVGYYNENLINNIVFESDSERPYYGFGTCGENLEWILCSDGEFVISGTGDMYDYADDIAPWDKKKSNIKSISFPDGITSIGKFAFYECQNLTSVIIPDGVISIGASAFLRCSNLTSITMPDSLTNTNESSIYKTGYYNDESNWENSVLYVGNHLIDAKTSIQGDYAIKENTKTIATGAFGNCKNLTSVTIPDSVVSIGQVAFAGLSDVKGITVDPANKNYSNDEFGVLFNKDKTVLIQYPIGNTRTSYEIPDSVKTIEYNAFNACIFLERVTFPNSVTSIGEFAFGYCIGLTEIIIPDGVTSIGDETFASCFSMEYIHIPSSVTSISDSIIMPDSQKTALVEDYKVGLDNLSEEELAEFAKMGITKEAVANWKPTTVICSDTEDCLAKTYAEEIGNEFRVCDGSHRIEVPDEPTTEPTTVPVVEPTTQTVETTTQTAETTTKAEETTVPVTEASTTEPAEIPSTTQPVTTEPADVTTTTKPVVETTTKPVETTKPVVEPTKPSTTKPIVESTTKTEPIEEEIIKKPSTSTVKYGETLILHADFTNIPEGAKIEWNVDGNGVTIVPSADGKTCAVTSTSTGDVTITAKYVDANGVEHVSEQEIKSNASFWQKIVTFFKNLFGINRIIEQIIKF